MLVSTLEIVSSSLLVRCWAFGLRLHHFLRNVDEYKTQLRSVYSWWGHLRFHPVRPAYDSSHLVLRRGITKQCHLYEIRLNHQTRTYPVVIILYEFLFSSISIVIILRKSRINMKTWNCHKAKWVLIWMRTRLFVHWFVRTVRHPSVAPCCLSAVLEPVSSDSVEST